MNKNLKSLIYLLLIYIPVLFLIGYSDYVISNLMSYNITTLKIILWIYVQCVVVYFFYLCFRGIFKIIKNYGLVKKNPE
jgi:TRAP-type C4-dicarboxylate transport system permease small subunit